jgi:hypothetical protein
MNTQKLNIRGTEIKKLPFSDIEFLLQEKGLNVDLIFSQIADQNEFVYVSNGFLRGLNSTENEIGEWHHYFTKDIDGHFTAGKLKFN